MAKLRVTTDAGGVLASRDIPDTALPKLQQAWGGTTAQETAGIVLDELMKMLRAATIAKLKEQRLQTDMVAVRTGQETEQTAADTAWPE